MQVTETLSDGLKRGYTVVVPAADIESRRASRFADLSKTITVPGFRPGRVPLPVVRQRFGKAVTAEVLEKSVSEATQQVIEERGLRPALQPKIDLGTLAIEPGPARDLEFTVELEVLPEITMPDFAALQLTRVKAEASPETVEQNLQQMARRNRTLLDIPPEALADRGAADGEILTVDFAGAIEGQPFPGGEGKDIDIEVGGSGFIEGFTAGLAGMKPDETRTIDLKFPDDYFSADLAGKPVSFVVTAKRLRKAEVPELNDEFAQKLAFETLDELRDFMKRRVQQEYDNLSRLRLKRQLLDALAEQANFAAPQGIVDREFEQIWRRLEMDRQRGQLDDDDKGKDEDTLRADYRAIADRRVRLGLLMAEIGRTNNITVSQEELTRALRAEASRYPGQAAEVMEFLRKTPAMSEAVSAQVLEEKVVDYVVELAQVTEQTVTPEELAEEPPPPARDANAAPEGASAAPAGAASAPPEAAEGEKPAAEG